MTRLPRGAAQFKWRRQRQEQARRWPTLNLVALMDVFTILVFFFLVHSADSTPQSYSELVKLPESTADEQPRDTPVVTITPDNILLEGEAVVAIATAMQASSGAIPALQAALQNHHVTDEQAQATANAERELTIMGDRTIPFQLLNKVMHTCTQAGYGNISLSVLQRASSAG